MTTHRGAADRHTPLGIGVEHGGGPGGAHDHGALGQRGESRLQREGMLKAGDQPARLEHLGNAQAVAAGVVRLELAKPRVDLRGVRVDPAGVEVRLVRVIGSGQHLLRVVPERVRAHRRKAPMSRAAALVQLVEDRDVHVVADGLQRGRVRGAEGEAARAGVLPNVTPHSAVRRLESPQAQGEVFGHGVNPSQLLRRRV